MAHDKDDDCTCDLGDVAALGPEQDGMRPYVRHCVDHTMQAGLLRPIKDGEPIHEGALFLRRRGSGPYYEIESIFRRSTGPAKVTSNAYRDGWDRIFSKPPASSLN